MLLCCWLAAVGAGLLKSEEILEGVARLRISDDIEFEEQNFIAIMNEAREVSWFLFRTIFCLPSVLQFLNDQTLTMKRL